MTWPDGLGGGLRLDGRCRDLLTSSDDAAPMPASPGEATTASAALVAASTRPRSAEPTNTAPANTGPGSTGPVGSVLAAADLRVHTGLDRGITSIASDPAHAGLERLIGRRGGGGLRAAIAEELPDQVEQGTPLHLLLDDLAGSTLIAGFAMFRWADHLPS